MVFHEPNEEKNPLIRVPPNVGQISKLSLSISAIGFKKNVLGLM
jgi:hypothetical protein